MPQINPSIPVAGQPNSTEDPKTVTALTQLVAAVNAVDNAQVATAAGIVDTKLASPNNAVWRPIFAGPIIVTPSLGAGVVHYPDSTGFTAQSGTGVTTAVAAWQAIAADVAVAGKTTNVRLRATLIVNGTAPAVNISPGLYPVTSFGGSGTVAPTLGASPVLVSAFATPAAGSTTTQVCSAISIATLTGVYVLGLAVGGTPAANSRCIAQVSLEMAHS